MKAWLVEPRDPLVVRDGRPPAAGMPNARSLDFPWPSTVAGLARTRAGLEPDGRFDEKRVASLLKEAVWGPWLAEVAKDGKASTAWLPAPRDAVKFHDGAGRLHVARLVPRPLPPEVRHSLGESLTPLGFSCPPPRGKSSTCGAFWAWPAIERWLVSGEAPKPEEVLEPLPHERRFHVSLDPETGTAAEGKLFVSDGLRFWGNRRLGLAFLASDGLALEPGPVKLGGEGRVSWLRRGEGGLPPFPEALVSRLESAKRARVVLVTPALFDGGALPRKKSLFGAPIVAARVDRPEVISGWDVAKGQPKPSRRMAGAGSVYWVSLEAVSSVRAWLEGAWSQPIPEQMEQDQRDGFGLAIVGVGT